MWREILLLFFAAVRFIFGNSIDIGIIFETSGTMEESIVKFAVDSINNNSAILPNHTINLRSKYSDNSTLAVLQTVCELLEERVAVIIGPVTSVSASYAICDAFRVPMVSPGATDAKIVSQDTFPYLLRLVPPVSELNRVIVDFVKHSGWSVLTILSDDTEEGVNGAMDLQHSAASGGLTVKGIYRFTAKEEPASVQVTEQLLNIKKGGVRIIILSCHAIYVKYVLNQAHSEGMLNAGWVWIGTDRTTMYEDLPMAHNAHFQGFIGIRPLTRNGSGLISFQNRWSLADPGLYPGAGTTAASLQFWPLLFYDSVHVVAHALHMMVQVDGLSLVPESKSCKQNVVTPWLHGETLNRYLRNTSLKGVTRDFEYNGEGFPLNPAYDIVRLGDIGWETIGTWNAISGLRVNITGVTTFGARLLSDVKEYVRDLFNISLRVATLVDEPFVFKINISEAEKITRGNKVCFSNDCYYGYVIDLLLKLASEIGFRFTLYHVADGKYGAYDDTLGKWNGMVADLLPDDNGLYKADLAAGAFMISHERQKVISCTKPFRDLQMGILIGTPIDQPFNPFSFLIPLDIGLWGFTLGTAVLIGLVISAIDKLSPYGHFGKKAQVLSENEHDAMDINDDGTVDYWEELEWRTEKATMNLHNATLWSLASLLAQGGERHPNSWSGRIIAGAWWLGALIIAQSYTANLAAYLTIRASANEINSMEDLAKHPTMRYGILRNSQTEMHFDSALREPYKTMGDNMRKWDSAFENTSTAVQYTKEQHGRFAFLGDYPKHQYWTGQECSLKLLKNGFWNVGYGFGLPLNSPYTEELSVKMYKLRESGYMDTLDEEWVVKTALCKTKTDNEIGEETVKIDMASLSGVFWILSAGMGLSILVLGLEWTCFIRNSVKSSTKKQSYGKAIGLHWRLLLADIRDNWTPSFISKWTKRRK